jgi:hypothetical protein
VQGKIPKYVCLAFFIGFFIILGGDLDAVRKADERLFKRAAICRHSQDKKRA